MKSKFPKALFIVKGLLAEYGVEALRNTLTSMIPAIGIAWFAGLDYAIPFVLGTLNASLTDFPGYRKEKLQGAAWGIICAVSTTLLIGYSLPYTGFLIPLIALLAAVFTMFSALGPRIGMIGTTTLFLIAFVMGLKPVHVPQFALCVGGGTAFFYLINILHSTIDPLWELRKAIANGYRNTATLLRIKAHCYDADVPLEGLYHRAAAISIKLADQQETVRHLLLRERRHLRKDRKRGYALWLRAYVLMDLYGMATALDHDYESIREKLQPIGALAQVRALVLLVADGMEVASLKNAHDRPEFLLLEENMTALLRDLERLTLQHGGEVALMLNGAIANARTFLRSVHQLRNRKGDELMENFHAQSVDLSGFLPPLASGIRDMLDHVRSYSPLFMFSIRMTVLFVLGGALGALLSDMKYTYWILITIIVVARPSYLLTQQRNRQRLLGTLGGVVLGLTLIFVFPNTYMLLFLISLLLFSFLLFNKRYYMVSVFFITAMVIVALHLHEDTWTNVLLNRVLFTFLGCGLALLGWYLVPVRHQTNVSPLAGQALEAHREYFDEVNNYVSSGVKGERFEIRLARKRAFLALTKFSDAVLQSQREPGKSKYSNQLIAKIHVDLYRLQAVISSFWIQHNEDVLDADRKERIEGLLDELQSKVVSV
ncbi:FUSC family protein [Sphingobacterium paludis]|uniref:Putative membrane protein YccC n=1 Tax=Sphingobacterium paludis TaxID=1476465 RepID=A0A4R7CSK2_9SPHI|nr:FUSC family membrane protein [Sphingobacterium paludis]TDS10981.1 putative membrane protein YccC [Sphingobacterium paludis]